MRFAGAIAILLLTLVAGLQADPSPELRTGVAQFAFDHGGDQSNLSDVCVAAGCNAIYTGLLGADGYDGLPPDATLSKLRQSQKAYLKKAKSQGIRMAIGYVCATSIVNLKSFDANWTPKFRKQFRTPPAQWRQVGKDGHVLVSWYNPPYEPACMNNPDWRTYEKDIIKMQLDTGCDGIFFDNPTVHPDGCYCQFCMEKFGRFLAARREPGQGDHSIEALRQWAAAHPKVFQEFRSGIAEDFLAEMRAYARSIKRGALMTCNNSLNAPDALFAQCRSMGYDINSASYSEDFITIEDMATQARKLPDGRTIEYGPIYKELHAIDHGKPIVATTLAEADYHASPNLARLSMAEAAANDASWLLWPMGPSNVVARIATNIFQEAGFLRRNEKLLNGTEPRSDVLLFLCFRRWHDTDHCAISTCASALTHANIQYAVCSEEDLAVKIASGSPAAPLLVIESRSILNPAEKQAIETFKLCGGRVFAMDEADWMQNLRHALDTPSITVRAPAMVRAVVRDQDRRTIVHLYNLDVQRINSFEDKAQPAGQVGITLRVPFRHVQSVQALTADADATHGPLKFVNHPDPGRDGSIVEFTVPKVDLSTILVVAP